jgi:hypothetical protein
MQEHFEYAQFDNASVLANPSTADESILNAVPLNFAEIDSAFPITANHLYHRYFRKP